MPFAKSSDSAKKKDTKKVDFPSAFELFEPSRKAIALNLITLIELVIVPLILTGVEIIFLRHNGHNLNLNYSLTTTSATPGASYYIVNGVSLVLFLLVAPALILTLLKGAKGEKIDLLPALRQGLPFLPRFIILAIVMAILVGGGFLLFILPGIWLYQRLFLAPYYLIDQNLGPWAAMSASWRAARTFSGAVWGVFGVVAMLTIGASLLSAIPGIGWLLGIVLIAIYYDAPAIRYFQITKAERLPSKLS